MTDGGAMVCFSRDHLAKFLLRFAEWVAMFDPCAEERSEVGGKAPLK